MNCSQKLGDFKLLVWFRSTVFPASIKHLKNESIYHSSVTILKNRTMCIRDAPTYFFVTTKNGKQNARICSFYV